MVKCLCGEHCKSFGSRVQVRGQIKLLCGGSIVFGLSEYPVSEFELVEELLMSDSTIKICRVEDLLSREVSFNIHRARTVIVDSGGLIYVSKLGCRKGIGEGNFSNGVGSGAGHGGKGGSGFYRGSLSEGGSKIW